MKRYYEPSRRDFASRQQVDQRRARVDQYKAQIDSDQAQIDYAWTQLGYTAIRSPIEGRAGIRQVDQGNYIHAVDRTPLVVITKLQPISVVFTLVASSVAQGKLTPGQTRIPVIAMAADAIVVTAKQLTAEESQWLDQTTQQVIAKGQSAHVGLSQAVRAVLRRASRRAV